MVVRIRGKGRHAVWTGPGCKHCRYSYFKPHVYPRSLRCLPTDLRIRESGPSAQLQQTYFPRETYVPTVPFPPQSYGYLAQEFRRGGDFRVFTVYVASSTTGAVKAFYASMMPQQVDLTGEVRWEQTASIAV